MKKDEEIENLRKRNSALNESNANLALWAVLATLLLIWTAGMAIAKFNHASADHLGSYMCKQHNMTYVSGKIEWANGRESIASMQILCRNEIKPKAIEDSYLYAVEG